MATWVEKRRYGRRAVLAGGTGWLAALGLSGCGLFDRRPDPAPSPDPLEPLRAQARVLADQHAAAITAVPALADRLQPLYDAHVTHVDELTRLIGKPLPSTSPSTGAGGTPAVPPEPTAALAALRTAEQAGARDAAAACMSAPADRASTIGSIAACRATHVEVLK
jgi:hypothetical protein